ncbi:MAG: hypothetical protein ACJATN_000427 [Neolewinella sp.]|jgi:hypothetical protein
MLLRLLSCTVLFSIICLSNLAAQRVEIISLAPGFGQVTAAQFTMVSVTNTGTEDHRGTLITTLTDLGGETVAELRSYPLTINAGQSLSSLDVSWPSRMTYGRSTASQSFARTGILGFGEFNICTAFIDNQGARLGRTCTERASVPAVQFSLVYPYDEMKIADDRPVLNWENIGQYGIAESNLSYSILLVEQLPGQSAATALETNLPLLSRERLRTNSLLYPIGARQLRPGKTYAWRVLAYAGERELIGSQQWTFQLAEEVTEASVSVAKSYAMLDTRINNRPYLFADAIQFGFDNNEGVKTLSYKIINLDKGGKPVKHLPPVTEIGPGLNTIDLPTKGLGLQKEQLYQLEVSTPRGQQYFLQFTIKP